MLYIALSVRLAQLRPYSAVLDPAEHQAGDARALDMALDEGPLTFSRWVSSYMQSAAQACVCPDCEAASAEMGAVQCSSP